MSDKYLELDSVLDEESFDYLTREYPALAVAVQKSVAKNISPEDIKRRVLEKLGLHREPLAQRCELAARHLFNAKA
jgi:hypothetical protein